MEKVKKFIVENNHFLYMLIWIPLLTCFYFCQKFLKPKYIMHCRIDDYIPFLKVFILAYVFWYFYMGIGFVYFGLKSKEDFLKLSKFIFWGMGISYAIYIVLPNGQDLRPVLYSHDIFTNMVRRIYSVDPPANVCPSIHVLNSIAVNVVVCKSKLFRDNKKIKIVSSIIMVLICMSTMFIKQHSLLDVTAGVILSCILYVSIYKIPYARKTKEENAEAQKA